LLTAAKFAEFPDLPSRPNVQKSELKIEPLAEVAPHFRIQSKKVSTSEKVNTTIVLNIESELDPETPIYAVNFVLSNPEFFHEPATALVPMMSNRCSLTFEMRSRKIGYCQLMLKVVYTNSEGDTVAFR
jgi:hypothetical protein